jgi:penicillin-binding protein 2
MVGGGLGIGQDKMTVTPLQIANAICIVANKGYYYTPHVVRTIDGENTADTTILNPYRKKHEVLTHIPDTSFNIVIDGMEDVTIKGTAKGLPKIPGINICAKTGTAENKRFLDGKVVQLKDHSLFVCFAPREDPKIAIAVIVENGGFGATWAGPMAYLLVEKYLTDSLRAERVKEVDRIAAANLMPSFLTREQFKADSIRGYKWFEMTKDSSYIEKFITIIKTPVNKAKKKKPVEYPAKQKEMVALLPDEKQIRRTAMR